MRSFCHCDGNSLEGMVSRIDLHAHSTRSDGKESPTEVFEHAATAGINVLALTDHDTTSGWAEAASAAQRLGLGFVPGIEVTTRARFEREGREFFIAVHMLAYLPDPNHAGLKAALDDSVESRIGRAQNIVERLSADFEITWDHVLEHLEDGATIGRPAIADALVTLGVVADRTEAFDRILGKSGKYYVANETTDVFDAIDLINQAGGVSVIAHPLGGARQSLDRADLPHEHFAAMIDAGLGGFEVYHREVPQLARDWLIELSAKHDLVVTGSSDYHGLRGKPNRLGENTTAPEMLQKIIDRASGTEALL
jgi:predicted metal-dependent phosphoesterase TrpH